MKALAPGGESVRSLRLSACTSLRAAQQSLFGPALLPFLKGISMVEDKSPSPVTRREFYATIGLVYLFVGLLGMAVASPAEGWLRSIVPWVVVIGVLVSGCAYSVVAIQAARGPEKPGDG